MSAVDVSDGDLIVVARVELERLRTELAATKDNASLLRAEVAHLRAVVRKLSARPEVPRG